MSAHVRPLVLIVCLAVALLGCAPAEALPAPTEALPTPTEEYVPEVDCAEEEMHPIVESIAEQFDVPYEQVMAWACGGEELEDILLALETSEMSERSPEELLKMKDEAGWEAVWEALGLEAEPAS